MKNCLIRRARRALPALTTLALAATAMTHARAALPHYTVADLPASVANISAMGVASSGDFLGGMFDSMGHVRAALVHDGTVTMLPYSPGSTFTSALAMNDQGTALAVDYTSTFVSDPPGSTTGYYDLINNQPYLYAQGTRTALPTSVDGKSPLYASVNNRGDVLGSIYVSGGGSVPYTSQAFIYHPDSGQFEMLAGLTGALPGTRMDNADRVYGVLTNASGQNHIAVYADGQLSSLPGTTFSGNVQLLSVNDAGQMLYTANQGLRSSLFFYDKGQSIELGFTQVDLSQGNYEITEGGMQEPAGLLADGTVLSRTMLFKDGETASLGSLIDAGGGQAPDIISIRGQDGQGRILFSDASSKLRWLVPTSAVPEPGRPAMMFMGLLAIGVWLGRHGMKKAPEGALPIT